MSNRSAGWYARQFRHLLLRTSTGQYTIATTAEQYEDLIASPLMRDVTGQATHEAAYVAARRKNRAV